MRIGWAWKSGCIALGLGISAALLSQLRNDDLLQNSLAFGDQALFVSPPRVIGDGVVAARWSPSGRHILYHQFGVPTGPDILAALMGNPSRMAEQMASPKLYCYTPKSGKSTLIDAKADPSELADEWFYSSDSLLRVQVTEDPKSDSISASQIQVVNLDTGGKTPWMGLPFSGYPRPIVAHPTLPRMACAINGERQRVAILTEQGKVMQTAEVPANFRIYSMIWAADGQRVILLGAPTEALAPGTTSTAPHRYYWTPATGDFQPIERVRYEDGLRPKENDFPYVISWINHPAYPGSSTELRSCVLKSDPTNDPNQTLLAPDAEMGELSPKGDAALYISDGVAMIRDFVPISKDQLEKMRLAAARAKVISNAKQMGLAMMMYGSDFDDEFPPANNFDLENVYPYVKNRSIMEGFTYTFAGGNVSSITNPSNTEMGFVSGPGGRAVVYMDGHVKWINNEENVLADLRRRWF